MRRKRRLIRGLLLAAAVIYIGICALMLIEQNRLLYIGTVLPPHPAGLDFPPFNDADGTQIGWLAEPYGGPIDFGWLLAPPRTSPWNDAPPPPPRGTIVFFHGNDEEAWQSEQNYASYFTSRGWRVVFPELRGFDFRRGVLPTHDSVIAEAIAVLRLARQRYPGPLWVAGNSLGAGIAAQAAKAGGAQRVLLFVPWDSMSAVAQERYPFVPARLLLWADGTDYNSCSALAGLGAKTYITYAGQDDIIPAHHAQYLAHCLGVPGGQVFALPAATHLDWYEQLTSGQWDSMLGAAP